MTMLRNVAARLTFALGLIASVLAGPARAQQPQADTAKKPAPAAPLPPEISGTLFANFQYGGPKGNRVQDRFELERFHFTVRAPAGDRMLVRFTADVFQQTTTPNDAFYRGWVMRAKYAYLQYDLLRGAPGTTSANVRGGLVHTPMIDAEEQFWVRALSQTAVEQSGFFSSSDAGVASTVTLPRKIGEVYAEVLNGNGFVSRETDRFKDFAARLTLTPFGNGTTILKGLTVSPWYYKGARASDFALRKGTVLAVPDARKKDRYGVLLGLKDPRFTLGASLARRADEVESADTLVATSPVVSDRDNNLVSVYSIIRPFAFASTTPRWPVSLVFRADRRPDRDADTYSRFYIAGIGYDLSKKAAVYLDWQSLQPQAGSRGPDTKTYFMHMVANF